MRTPRPNGSIEPKNHATIMRWTNYYYTWKHNPDLTEKEIAEMFNKSEQTVSKAVTWGIREKL